MLLISAANGGGDEPLHRVEQLQPVSTAVRHGQPLIKTLFALEKPPLAAHAPGIHLQLHALFRDPLSN